MLALLSGGLSLLGALIAGRLSSASLRLPLGDGDAVAYYQLANTMIRFGWFTWNPDIGYPYGMDGALNPNPEIHQWLLLKLIAQFTSNPILALNAFFLVGFFLVGACSYLLFQATVRKETFAVLLAVSAATVPWHFGRFPHILLAEYSSIPVAVLLGFLMWTGWWSTSRRRFILAIVAAAYVGTGGVYYTLFACIIVVPVLLGRILADRAWRAWWRDAVVMATILLTLGAALLAQSAAIRQPAVEAIHTRDATESLVFAGRLFGLVTPWPLSDRSAEGDPRFNVIGSAATMAAFAVLVGLLVASRRPPSAGLHAAFAAEVTPWLRLLVWSILWFIPGFGFIFAIVVSPSIRSWGRMSIVILYVAMIILGICLRTWSERGKSQFLVAAISLGLVLSGQLLQDHRPLFSAEVGPVGVQAATYADLISKVLAEGCPVLQIPVMRFPEGAAPQPGMGSYDHMWPQIYAPGLRWSFGVVAGTAGARSVKERYLATLPPSDIVTKAQADGFCAIHLDSNGLSAAQSQQWAEELGEPAAEAGRWRLYVLKE